MMKVLFLDTVHEVLAERLTAAVYTCIQAADFTYDMCVRMAADADGLVIRSRFPMDESFLKCAPKLKFIARSGAGMENIDVPYCEERNIVLFNAPEGNRNAVGEQALGMLLCLFNKLHTADREVRNGKWDREGNRGIELDGKTVGIIGYGNNGSAFARKLAGFDVEVLAYDKYKTNFSDNYVKEVGLDELYAQSDVISFHIPQNEETLFWGNKVFFEQVEKPFYLLNLSRGKIVSIADLLMALDQRKVLGACLDVLEFEKSSFENMFEGELPEVFQALLKHPNVLLSPHVGGWTVESYFKLSNVLADKILAHNWA
jgi:D-3-phosphoglycerate dehydrogenase / 2-oxoglutarate reductase